MARIGSAYAVEVAKAVRQRFTFVGPALALLLALSVPLQYPPGAAHANGFVFVAKATSMVNVLSVILILSYAAGLVSSEVGSGVLRHVLVRPLYRWEFLAAKLLLGMTYALAITVTAGVASWAIAIAFGNVTGVSYGGEVVYTATTMFYTYCFSLLLSLAPQFATVTYAVMISCLTRSTAAAITTAIGIWFAGDLLKYHLHVAGWLFSSYLDKPWQVFADRCDGLPTSWFPMATHTLAASGGAIFVFGAVAVYVFRRRDLHG